MLRSFAEAIRNHLKEGDSYKEQLRRIRYAWKEAELLPTEYYGLNTVNALDKQLSEYRGIRRSKEIWNRQSSLLSYLGLKYPFQHLLRENYSDVLYVPKVCLRKYIGASPTNNIVLQLRRECDSLGCPSVYIKPTRSYGGKGVMRLDASSIGETLTFFDTKCNVVRSVDLTNAHVIDADLPIVSGDTYIVQEAVESRAYLEEGQEYIVGSMRLLVKYDGKASIVSAVQKLIKPPNIIDNFSTYLETPGNLIGKLNIHGSCDKWYTNDRTFTTTHDFMLVYADFNHDMSTIVKIAERLLYGTSPGRSLTGWDVILTANGPVVLEINVLSGFEMFQVVEKVGLDALLGDF